MNLNNTLGKDSFFMVNKKLLKELGFEATLLLSDLISKEQYFKDRNTLDNEGFFFNTQKNIEEDTTLTRYQLDNAINILEGKNFIETKLKGMPQRKHYRILATQIASFLQIELQKTYNDNKNKDNKNKDNNSTAIADAKTNKNLNLNTVIGIYKEKQIDIPNTIFKSNTERASADELIRLKGVKKISSMLDYCLELVENTKPEEKRFILRFDTPYHLLKNYEAIKMKM